jgi:citrate lyase gamma subunit
MNRLLMVFLTAAALAPAVMAEETPDWVNGSGIEYPREKYVTGVGVADDRATAEDRARAEISRVFSTNVTVSDNVTSSESTQNGAKSETSFSQQVGEIINTTSHKILEGVEIADNWQNKETRQYYALAVLDRAKAVVMVNEKIAAIDAQTATWKDAFGKTQEKFDKVKAAVKLSSLAKAKDQLVAELRVLNPDAAGLVKTDASLSAEIAKTIASLNLGVMITGENGRQVETGLIGALTEMGFETTSITSADAPGMDIIITATVVTDPPGTTEALGNWKRARSTATIALKDGKSGKTFKQFDASVREDSQIYNEAVKRSLSSLAGKTAKEAKAAINSYFENQ